MTKPSQLEQFTKVDVPAAPERAAQMRHEFSDWLRQHFTLDPVRASDVLLAVNEALANAAEFAYLSAPRPGVMHLRADYDKASGTLTVTIADEGAWRPSDPGIKDPARGRGIPLMHALTDHAAIDSTPAGTHVRLQWDGVPPAAGCALDGHTQDCGSRTT